MLLGAASNYCTTTAVPPPKGVRVVVAWHLGCEWAAWCMGSPGRAAAWVINAAPYPGSGGAVCWSGSALGVRGAGCVGAFPGPVRAVSRGNSWLPTLSHDPKMHNLLCRHSIMQPSSVARVHDDPAAIRRSRRSEIGSRVRSLREMRGGKQDAVAIEAGISRVTLQNIESGATNFQIDKLLAVADALSVPVSWFFVDTWSTPPGSPFDDPA